MENDNFDYVEEHYHDMQDWVQELLAKKGDEE